MESILHSLEAPCFTRSTGLANSIVTGFIQTLLTAYCNIANDNNWPQEHLINGAESYDFIVIGGGTAGSVVAGRLAENPNIRVLIIEAGDDPPIESKVPGFYTGLFGSKYDYNYVTKSNNKSCLIRYGQACDWPRGKMMGGSSAMNAMLYVRGNRRDYDIWEADGNPTWGWDSIYKYFKKTENYQVPDPHHLHGVNGPMKVTRSNTYPSTKKMILQAAVEGGYEYVDDFREGHNLGFGILNALIDDGVRTTPAIAFLLQNKPNLKVIKNAQVIKINFDKNKRATSVNLVYKDKLKEHNIEVKATKEIILSAGSVETPKLLMLSGIGPRKLLKALKIPVLSDLAVGRNLQDHVNLNVYFRSKDLENITQLQTVYDYFVHRKGQLRSVSIIDTSAFLDARNETDVYPTVQTVHLWFPMGQTAPDITVNNVLSDTIGEILKETGILSMGLVLLRPKSKGYIKLRSTDPSQQPVIYPNYLSHPDDMDALIRTLRELRKLEFTPTFRKYGVEFIDIPLPQCAGLKYGTYEYWDCFIRCLNYSIFHSVGTAKMGPDSDPEAVVDYKLRVKGVNKLRVVDASIMPKIPSANTMAPTVMIAEKAADFIKEDWRI